MVFINFCGTAVGEFLVVNRWSPQINLSYNFSLAF